MTQVSLQIWRTQIHFPLTLSIRVKDDSTGFLFGSLLDNQALFEINVEIKTQVKCKNTFMDLYMYIFV